MLYFLRKHSPLSLFNS